MKRIERLEDKNLTLREKAEELLSLVCESKGNSQCHHICSDCTKEIEDYLSEEV